MTLRKAEGETHGELGHGELSAALELTNEL